MSERLARATLRSLGLTGLKRRHKAHGIEPSLTDLTEGTTTHGTDLLTDMTKGTGMHGRDLLHTDSTEGTATHGTDLFKDGCQAGMATAVRIHSWNATAAKRKLPSTEATACCADS